MELLNQNMNIDFVGKMKRGMILSVFFLCVGVISIFFRGEKNFGIDFTGGVMEQIAFFKPTTAQILRDSFKKNDLKSVSLQEVHDGNKTIFMVRSSLEEIASLREAIKNIHGEDQFEVMREEMVGPTVGKDLRRQGLYALIFALLGILIYVSFRFEFKYAVGAIAALFHDILITAGLLSFFQVELSIQILAALLTIVGYSLNDTIVVFDRIRETKKMNTKNQSFSELINISINQTLSRTILTSITTFIVVLMLFLFGGTVIHEFALALMIGVIVGTYSSVFVAGSLLRYWNEKS
ncbi:protein-export membrane protein SecF [PVC group bacterium (ex Bugula neritina AB1)]|nr:protein-export membrane protein SecF [PVC group bacterium (ex Bugula neritina AB1)]